MTSHTAHNPQDSAREDALFDERIRNAYETLEPTDEQLARMKGAVQAYAGQGARGAASSPTPNAQANPEFANAVNASSAQHVQPAPAPAQPPQHEPSRKRRPRWQWALPAAACLVIVALGVGVIGTQVSTIMGAIEAPVASDKTTEALQSQNQPSADALYSTYEAEEVAPGLAPMPAFDDFNTEEYSLLEETGFVSTRSNPLSTVSADVDTAAYCNLRRMLRQGAEPGDIPAGAVRIEEMLNYFTYNYAAPQEGELLGTTVSAGDCPWNPDTKLLVMGFATPSEDASAISGRNLVFLIDVSGSMDQPDKLGLLQDSFATLLEGLGENDRVSIVTYSGQEEVVLEGAKGSDEREILRAIYRLQADGSTNGEAGLKMAYEVAERNRIDGGVNRIIMASDGDLNVGMTSESDLHDFVEEKRETGIYLSVLGFGSGNYKDNKMETLADYGNGQYHYIDCIEEAERVFGENLTANLVPLADDVKIQLEFNPAQVKAYRLIGYENRAMADEDFANDAKDAGDIGPNAQFTVAYEIVLADSAFEIDEPDLKYGSDTANASDSTDWLTCSMRYKPAGKQESKFQEMAVSADALEADPGDDWRFAASIIEFGMVLRGSEYAGSADLDSALELARSASPEGEKEGLVELIELAQGA